MRLLQVSDRQLPSMISTLKHRNLRASLAAWAADERMNRGSDTTSCVLYARTYCMSRSLTTARSDAVLQASTAFDADSDSSDGEAA